MPICRYFPRWRDPDSNRGHHDFQPAAGTTLTTPICGGFRGFRDDRRHGDPRGSTPIPGGSAPGGRFRGRTLGRLEEGAIAALLIGYARVSTDEQDLTAQRDALTSLA